MHLEQAKYYNEINYGIYKIKGDFCELICFFNRFVKLSHFQKVFAKPFCHYSKISQVHVELLLIHYKAFLQVIMRLKILNRLQIMRL